MSDTAEFYGFCDRCLTVVHDVTDPTAPLDCDCEDQSVPEGGDYALYPDDE